MENADRAARNLPPKLLPKKKAPKPPLKPAIWIGKKNGAYQCVTTNHFRFVDLCSYLPPGFSLAKVLLTVFGDKDKSLLKGSYPYHFSDSLHAIYTKKLPELEDYWDADKRINTLEEKLLLYNHYIDSGLDHEKTLAKMKLDSKPLTAAENYKILRDGWDAMNITNLYELNVAYVK